LPKTRNRILLFLSGVRGGDTVRKTLALVSCLFVLPIILSACGGVSDGNSPFKSQFDVEVTPVRFVQRTPHPAGLLGASSLDPGFFLSVPSNGLTVTVKVTPTSFTGEPFIERKIGEEVATFSQPVWVLLYSRDGYLFGWNGPITWVPDELEDKDLSNVRDYNAIQRASGEHSKTVTFYLSATDKDVVALREETEQYLKSASVSERYLYFNRIGGEFGEWLGATEQVEKINQDTARITNRYFRVDIAGKEKIEALIEQKYEE